MPGLITWEVFNELVSGPVELSSLFNFNIRSILETFGLAVILSSDKRLNISDNIQGVSEKSVFSEICILSLGNVSKSDFIPKSS